MTGQELKVLFKEDKAYLTADRPLSFKQLGLPEVAETFKLPAYWTIKVLKYIEEEKKIYCEVISYHVGVTEFGHYQKLIADKLNDIQIVTFRSIYTPGLLNTLNGNATSAIRPQKSTHLDRNYDRYQSEHIVKIPLRQTIKSTFFVPLKRVSFKHGGVSFEKKFKELQKTLELAIINHDIREEFDAVKNYFANVLKTKKIEVTVTLGVTGKEAIPLEVKSPEIEKIDKQLIEDVKLDIVKSITKKTTDSEFEKSLFTMEEYFDTFTDEMVKSSTFYKNDKELFDDLLAIHNKKHYNNLGFLSSRHAHEIMKLRFVHKPISFVFLIQGARNYHIVWETLNTAEATYIWHVAKDISVLKMALRNIEAIINGFKATGKRDYISLTEDEFSRVYHDYTDINSGFVKWKDELESILT